MCGELVGNESHDVATRAGAKIFYEVLLFRNLPVSCSFQLWLALMCSRPWYSLFEYTLDLYTFDTFNLYSNVLKYPEYHVFTLSESITAKKNHYYQPQREFCLATKVLWRENPLQTYILSDKFLHVSHYEWVKLTYILPSWRK